jgi:flagellar biosynthesis protein FlhB
MGTIEGKVLLTVIVYFIYGATLAVTIIFTFFQDLYLKIEEILSFNLGQSASASLGKNLHLFDLWMINHNKIVGPVMIVLSALNMKFCLYLTKMIFANQG